MKILFAFCIFFTLVGCATIKPTAPEVITENKQETTEQHIVNKIVAPISMDLSSYFVDADKQIPKTTSGSDYPCTGVRYNFEFTKDNFKINTKNNELFSELDGSYWIKMNYCSKCTNLFGGNNACLTPLVPFSCGINETKPSVKIQLSTRLNVNKDYAVEANTRIENIKPINPCKVTIFKFDATEEIMKRVKSVVEKSAKDLDKDLSSISFKKEAEELWNNLKQSFAVANLGYVHIRPTGVSLVEPKLIYNKLYTTIVLDCSTYLDQNPDNINFPSLPKLKIVSEVPRDTFEVVTDFKMNYDSLSHLMTEQISGKTVELKGNTFIFNKATIQANSSNKAVIGVEFGGSKKGILYLIGTPTFDNENKIFSLEKLEYELQTKSTLLKMADWLFSKKITNELYNATRFDLKEEFKKLKTNVNKSLNRDVGSFKISGQLLDANVESIQMNKDFLSLKTSIEAKLKVAGK